MRDASCGGGSAHSPEVMILARLAMQPPEQSRIPQVRGSRAESAKEAALTTRHTATLQADS
jgi:hypothetical protein